MERAAAASDFASYSGLNLEFHDFIVRATGNSRLTKIYQTLVKEFQLFRMHGLVQADALLASQGEHLAIVAALEARDARRSYEVGFEHVAKGKARMLAALAVLSEPGGSAAHAGGPGGIE